MVIHLISSYSPYIGGAEKATEVLVQGLQRCGWTPRIWTRAYRTDDLRVTADGLVSRLGVARRSKVGALSYIQACLVRLSARQETVDLLHAQGQHAPLVVAALARLLLGLPYVQTIHTDPQLSFAVEGLWGRLKLLSMKHLAEKVIALTEAMATDLVELGIPRDKVLVIPNAVDGKMYLSPAPVGKRNAKLALGVPEDVTLLIFVGRLVSLKRVDALLRAWSVLPIPIGERFLLVVGDGPERDCLEKMAASLELRGVRFEGHVDDVRPYLMAADVFVLPSSQEGLSIALLEAMAAGLVPVVSDLPGHHDLVKDGLTGFVIPSSTQQDLEGALKRALCSQDSGAMGHAAAEVVRAGYGREKVAEAHHEAYCRILGVKAEQCL